MAAVGVVRGSPVAVPAAAESRVGGGWLGGGRCHQRADRAGPVFRLGTGLEPVDQPAAGRRSVCQPAPAQPVRHADQHRIDRAAGLAGTARKD